MQKVTKLVKKQSLKFLEWKEVPTKCISLRFEKEITFCLAPALNIMFNIDRFLKMEQKVMVLCVYLQYSSFITLIIEERTVPTLMLIFVP
jgi:hypothetical protein